MKKIVYMDYAAATPIDGEVRTAMEPYFSDKFYNPSATYLAAKSVHADVEAARAKVAQMLGARAPEIIFTAGGTEANNIATHGVMRAFPGKKILVGAIEHESVLAAAHQYDCLEIPANTDGLINLSALENLIDDDTVLVSVAYANSEVGTIQPMREVAQIIHGTIDRRREKGNKLPLYFHSDATGAANYLDLHISRLGVDMMTLNGGKIYGPKQSGALYIRGGVTLLPVIGGGGQEQGLRSGTENVPAIIGFGAALFIAQNIKRAESSRLAGLQQLFLNLLKSKIPSTTINGSLKKRLPNNVHLTLPGQDNERLLMGLDEAGILAAAGSACSASSEEPSHVLRAMGLSDADAQSSLRFTMGRATTEQDVRRAVDTLAQLLT